MNKAVYNNGKTVAFTKGIEDMEFPGALKK